MTLLSAVDLELSYGSFVATHTFLLKAGNEWAALKESEKHHVGLTAVLTSIFISRWRSSRSRSPTMVCPTRSGTKLQFSTFPLIISAQDRFGQRIERARETRFSSSVRHPPPFGFPGTRCMQCTQTRAEGKEDGNLAGEGKACRKERRSRRSWKRDKNFWK